MSEQQRDSERSDAGETEEPVQDPSADDFEAHRHIDRDAERDDSGGMPNRDDPGRDDPGRHID